ncbi:MAG: hypothetical protein MJZ81_11480 [Bacteroidales bacterium]|nr:hypothetical protein [Bacteroidales bacterium]
MKDEGLADIVPETFKGVDVESLLKGMGSVSAPNVEDLSPHDVLSCLSYDVKSYWLRGCESCEYEDESLVQVQKAAAILLFALMKHDCRDI